MNTPAVTQRGASSAEALTCQRVAKPAVSRRDIFAPVGRQLRRWHDRQLAKAEYLVDGDNPRFLAASPKAEQRRKSRRRMKSVAGLRPTADVLVFDCLVPPRRLGLKVTSTVQTQRGTIRLNRLKVSRPSTDARRAQNRKRAQPVGCARLQSRSSETSQLNGHEARRRHHRRPS
jgi:hypothetical protein